MSDLTIRYADKNDAAILAELGARTFRETYYTDSHLETKYIDSYIAATFNTEEVGTDLKQEEIIFLLAKFAGDLIAYVRLCLNSRRPEIAAESPLEISRIYLTKESWGQGHGAILLERCFEEAEKNSADAVWLSVWQYNERAIAFYNKHGFRQVGEHIFDLASSPQTDFIMLKDFHSKDQQS